MSLGQVAEVMTVCRFGDTTWRGRRDEPRERERHTHRDIPDRHTDTQTHRARPPDLLHDLVDLGLEAHVEHAVRLVEDQVGHPAHWRAGKRQKGLLCALRAHTNAP